MLGFSGRAEELGISHAATITVHGSPAHMPLGAPALFPQAHPGARQIWAGFQGSLEPGEPGLVQLNEAVSGGK